MLILALPKRGRAEFETVCAAQVSKTLFDGRVYKKTIVKRTRIYAYKIYPVRLWRREADVRTSVVGLFDNSEIKPFCSRGNYLLADIAG